MVLTQNIPQKSHKNGGAWWEGVQFGRMCSGQLPPSLAASWLPRGEQLSSTRPFIHVVPVLVPMITD